MSDSSDDEREPKRPRITENNYNVFVNIHMPGLTVFHSNTNNGTIIFGNGGNVRRDGNGFHEPETERKDSAPMNSKEEAPFAGSGPDVDMHPGGRGSAVQTSGSAGSGKDANGTGSSPAVVMQPGPRGFMLVSSGCAGSRKKDGDAESTPAVVMQPGPRGFVLVGSGSADPEKDGNGSGGAKPAVVLQSTRDSSKVPVHNAKGSLKSSKGSWKKLKPSNDPLLNHFRKRNREYAIDILDEIGLRSDDDSDLPHDLLPKYLFYGNAPIRTDCIATEPKIITFSKNNRRAKIYVTNMSNDEVLIGLKSQYNVSILVGLSARILPAGQTTLIRLELSDYLHSNEVSYCSSNISIKYVKRTPTIYSRRHFYQSEGHQHVIPVQFK